MFGLIGRITAHPGKRDELVTILVPGQGSMPGCLSYIVACDPTDADAIYVTEAWENEAAHAASLMLSSVRDAIARARPLIANFETIAKTTPVGGIGLATSWDNP